MAYSDRLHTDDSAIPSALKRFLRYRLAEVAGLSWLAITGLIIVALASWSAADPSRNNATENTPQNLLGSSGAMLADEVIQFFGLASIVAIGLMIIWPISLIVKKKLGQALHRLINGLGATIATAAFLGALPRPDTWPLSSGLGGALGDLAAATLIFLTGLVLGQLLATAVTLAVFGLLSIYLFCCASGTVSPTASGWLIKPFYLIIKALDYLHGLFTHYRLYRRAREQRQSSLHQSARAEPPAIAEPAKPAMISRLRQWFKAKPVREDFARDRREPVLSALRPAGEEVSYGDSHQNEDYIEEPADDEPGATGPSIPIETRAKPPKQSKRLRQDIQPAFVFDENDNYQLPALTLLAQPKKIERPLELTNEALEQNARMLEGVLEDFGIRGEIIHVRPGPVVTLYELEPAPGIKSSRVIGLADDIARSMSAISARVAVVPGRNVIGIELPNSTRETVYLREMLGSTAYEKTKHALAIALGKNIGGEPIFADLARMPHLLIAGTTGSGKSVGINTIILSLLYRHSPETCKLIMIDPKMLELSVYEGIPHLLSPVVTDPRKAVVALKWAVREMEDRYRLMSKLGVRNVDGFNAKVRENLKTGEVATRVVQTGYDPETGQPVYETEEIDIKPMPFIVVIIDEMADLMMVAGKDIEGAVQRLAQMARAAGIHVVMATQRPSVDVITGTIKANFPTRISFQVTSKIDSRTILGEQGAEHLLGQGDMLYMAGGGRISRLHGPFVSDGEVEEIVSFLKTQGAPKYVEAVTEESEEDAAGLDLAMAGGNSGDELYDKAVAVVLRDKKVSTSYIQRRLQIGYNRAASLIERMENEGVISAANHAGKREILVGNPDVE